MDGVIERERLSYLIQEELKVQVEEVKELVMGGKGDQMVKMER